MKKAKPTLIFINQLATLLTAGIPLNKALQFLEASALQKQVEAGQTLSQALETAQFLPLVVAMVKVGGKTGRLIEVLNELANHLRQQIKRSQQFKKALTYPLFVAGFSLLITLLMIIYLVPNLEQYYATRNISLPFFSQLMIAAVSALKYSLPLIILAGWWFSKHPIKLPLLGKAIKKNCCIHIAQTLALTLRQGLTMSEALMLSAKSTPYPIYQSAMEQAVKTIRDGGTLSTALINPELFPPLWHSLLKTGEKASALPAMLTQIATFYLQELETETNTFTVLLEPILIILVGLIIGCIVVALYLPIFKLGSIY